MSEHTDSTHFGGLAAVQTKLPNGSSAGKAGIDTRFGRAVRNPNAVPALFQRLGQVRYKVLLVLKTAGHAYKACRDARGGKLLVGHLAVGGRSRV